MNVVFFKWDGMVTPGAGHGASGGRDINTAHGNLCLFSSLLVVGSGLRVSKEFKHTLSNSEQTAGRRDTG